MSKLLAHRRKAFTQEPKLLDSYSGASAAYSLRELSSAWAGQPVIEVYRADGATQNFTADEITNGTMATFLGTNGGFVETWYDQSGSGFDLTTNATGTNKPRIYTGISQTVTEVNGKPAIEIASPYSFFNATNNIPYNGGVSWYSVVDLTNVGNTRIWSDDITGVQGYTTFLTENTYSINDNGAGYKNIPITAHEIKQQLSSFHFNDTGGAYEIARDGLNSTGTISGWNGPIGTSGSANIGVGGSGNSQQVINGFYQELIVYPDNQSSNRVGIETNINSYYGLLLRKSLPNFTGYTNGLQTVSASTELGTTLAAWKAFDGTTNAWLSTALPSWIKIDFGTSTNCSRIVYNVRNDTSGIQSPQDYVIESSDDNTNWTTRSTVTGAVRDQVNDITHDFDTQNASARYWRLYCTNGYGETRIGLEKLEWWGS